MTSDLNFHQFSLDLSGSLLVWSCSPSLLVGKSVENMYAAATEGNFRGCKLGESNHVGGQPKPMPIFNKLAQAKSKTIFSWDLPHRYSPFKLSDIRIV